MLAGGAILGLAALLFTQVLPGRFDDVPVARNPMSFPRFLLLLLALGGVALMLRGLTAAGRHVALQAAWPRAASVAGLTLLYLVAFRPVGYLPATLVFLPAMMGFLGYRRPLVILVVTIATTVILWYLFAEIFVIRPPGAGLDTILRALGGP